jgi:C-methyltransferase C-terminal domain
VGSIFTENDIPAIAEINADKFGCVTPGTHIPIVSEAEARAIKPDYSWCYHGTSKRVFCSEKKSF